jgi:hypothetical protein
VVDLGKPHGLELANILNVSISDVPAVRMYSTLPNAVTPGGEIMTNKVLTTRDIRKLLKEQLRGLKKHSSGAMLV